MSIAKIGITEAGDAGLDLSWSNKLDDVEFAILITKNCTGKAFRELVLQHKDKVMLHCTITTYGGTRLEPNVPTVSESLNGIRWLIYEGFPASQIVIRIDPIIPTAKGIARVNQLLKMLCNEADYVGQAIEGGFKYPTRIKYSFIDMYKHVIARFKAIGWDSPYVANSFAPTQHMVDNTLAMLKQYNFQYSSCNENTPHKCACISEYDCYIMGVDKDYLIGSANQRKGCLCPANKTELLTHKYQCPHKCLYCYWR